MENSVAGECCLSRNNVCNPQTPSSDTDASADPPMAPPCDRRWSLPSGHSSASGRSYTLPPSNNPELLSPARTNSSAVPPSSDTRGRTTAATVLRPRPITSSLLTLCSTGSQDPTHTSTSFDGGTLSVRTVLTTFSALGDPAGQHGLADNHSPTRTSLQREIEPQRTIPFSAGATSSSPSRACTPIEEGVTMPTDPLPWPSSEGDSAVQLPTWSSKSTLWNILPRRRRSQSLPSARSTGDAPIADGDEAMNTGGYHPATEAASTSSSDMGATAGSDGEVSHRGYSSLNGLDDSSNQEDYNATPPSDHWNHSTTGRGPRPSPDHTDFLRRRVSSIATFDSQGASDSLVNLSVLTFAAFTLFTAFYTLIEMRQHFALARTELATLRSLVLNHGSLGTVQRVREHRTLSTTLFSPWLETLFGAWLVIIAVLVGIVVWDLCPSTARRVATRLRRSLF